MEQLNKNNQQQKQQTNQKSILSENKQEKTNQNGVPLSIFQPLVLNHYSRMTFSQDENQPLPKHQTNLSFLKYFLLKLINTLYL